MATELKLNLGCGEKHLQGYINIDNDPAVSPDKVIDIATVGLSRFGDSTAEEVKATDFLEHIPIDKTIFVIDEIWRVLRPGGQFKHMTPSTDGRGAFQDPTHRSFWNRNSWMYYCPDMVGGRRFYGIKAHFRILRLEDVWTDPENRVLHTVGIMVAVK